MPRTVIAAVQPETRDSSDASTSTSETVSERVPVEGDDKSSFLFNLDDEEDVHEVDSHSDSSDSGPSSDPEDHLPLSSEPDPSTSYSFDKSSIADLVATYGSSSSTAWLEFDRYRIWQAASSPTISTEDRPYIPESTFPPTIGYMHTKRYLFPWGDPIVSSPAALAPAAAAFVSWAKKQGLRVVWCCVGHEMEEVLARMGWATLECIYEEVLHPEHVLELTSLDEDGKEKKEKKKERKSKEEKEKKEKKEEKKVRESSAERFDKEKLKDLKKNLRRAERAGVHADEVTGKWHQWERGQVEQGMIDWRKSKGLKGVQLASTTGLPWIDEKHRRYWVARHENQIVGVLILTPIHPPHDSHHPDLGMNNSPPASPTSPTSPTSPITPHIKSYLIKNAVSFPSAPRGTSEHLIHTALSHLAAEEHTLGIPITVTFGITASETLKIGHNLGGDHNHVDANGAPTGSGKAGWKITTLSTIYNKVAKGAGLLKRGDFRAKFDTEREGMYVAYEVGAKGEGMGLDGVKSLLKVLRK